MAKVCVFLAEGFEECEGLLAVDLLRRAGVEVTTASVGEKREVLSSHGITILADALAAEVNLTACDMIVLPGGLKGTENLAASELVRKAVQTFCSQDKLVGAICAAPSILATLGLLEGRRAVCHPDFEPKLTGAQLVRRPVAEDGNLITGRGLGAGIPFALALVRRLAGEEEAERIRAAIVYPYQD